MPWCHPCSLPPRRRPTTRTLLLRVLHQEVRTQDSHNDSHPKSTKRNNHNCPPNPPAWLALVDCEEKKRNLLVPRACLLRQRLVESHSSSSSHRSNSEKIVPPQVLPVVVGRTEALRMCLPFVSPILDNSSNNNKEEEEVENP